jgi:repressor LexA
VGNTYKAHDMLTKKQFELLKFIDVHIKEHGVSPSFDEMKDALNLKSKSGIHRLISALEERGFIARLAHRARALEVLRLPDAMNRDNVAPAHTEDDPELAANIIQADFTGGSHGDDDTGAGEAVALPLYGRIAAGLPIEALRDNSQTIDIPANLISGGEHYALEVAGDSMIEAGILDGDIVVIRRTDTAGNGEIVVALVDDSEVTLKKIRRRGDSIALEPANAAHETRIFGPDQVKVQGTLAALFRSY